MRYNEIINELKMNPSHLAKFGQTTGGTILAGFEAEVILNDVREPHKEPDYSVNENIHYSVDLDDIANFFDISRSWRSAPREWKELENEYEEWQKEQVTGFVNYNAHKYADKLADEYNHSREEEEHLTAGDFEQEGREEAEKDAENHMHLDLHQFLVREKDFRDYKDIAEYYNFTWPQEQTVTPKDWDLDIAEEWATELGSYLKKPVIANTTYHGGRSDDAYHIEPDSSLTPDDKSTDMAMEIVSYPMPLPEMMDDLQNAFYFIDQYCYTNESTGLHINMSIPGKDIDYVKLVLFLGDEHVLDKFDRASSTFARSALHLISKDAQNGAGGDAYAKMKQGLLDIAGKTLRARNVEKYTSVNMHDTYVEFRSMGGDYVTQWGDIKNTILRFAQALTVACDPQAQRKEYGLKLYKLLSTQQSHSDQQDPIKMFSLFGSGALPKDQLQDYLRDRKAERTRK
jgi:hypothetical protein